MKFNLTVMAIVSFVVLFVFALGTHCHGAEQAGMAVRAGSTVLRGIAPMVELSYQIPVPTSEDAHAEISADLIGASTWRGHQNGQVIVSVRYVDGFGPMDAGIGVAAMQNEDAFNTGRINFNLMLGYHRGQFSIRFQHYSNAGTRDSNIGRDMVLVGWRFK